MSLKLVVTRETDPSYSREYLFDQEAVVIGREAGAEVVLPDTQRLISKQHAKIEQAGGAYYLRDLGSKNHTYLNGILLESGRHPLDNEDCIKIGDFELRFFLIRTAYEMPVYERTIFMGARENAFEEDARYLEEALRRLYRKYAHAAPERREEELRDALARAVSSLDACDAAGVLASVLQAESPGDVEQNDITIGRQAAPGGRRGSGKESAPQMNQSRRESAPRQAATGSGTRAEQALMPLAAMMRKLLEEYRTFQHESLGQTIIETPGAFSLEAGAVQEVCAYLLDPAASQEEWEHRLALVKDTAKDLVAHQTALQQAARGSIDKGVEELLRSIDPDALEREAGADAPRIGPIQLSIGRAERTLALFRKRFQALRNQQEGKIEKKYFRQNFLRLYQTIAARVRAENRSVF